MLLFLNYVNLVLEQIILQQLFVDPAINPVNWFQFGIAGVLAFLLYLLLKYIRQRDKYEQDRSKERSEMYRDDNKVRDQRFIEALQSIDISGERFVEATNSNIEKFIQLVNKVMEQSNFQTQTLIELKTIISKLPSEFHLLKADINEHLRKLVISYNLTKKEED